MADPIGRPDPNHHCPSRRKRLQYAFDAAGSHPSDDGESATATHSGSSVSDSSDSDGESTGLADLAASFQVFSESMLRMELAELEMAKAREARRLAAENRRAELESELTQMLLQTQVQIASYVSRSTPRRKRKRSDEDDDYSSTFDR
ncbi:uncharacterized protein LOC127794602 isoform X2 [Diospyros lotus]|nr:uncharacterized protein LOC127794602 isoform X2 [Diospyros lotus]